jgi:hypothetical protein
MRKMGELGKMGDTSTSLGVSDGGDFLAERLEKN